MDEKTLEFLNSKIKKKGVTILRNYGQPDQETTLIKIEGDFCMLKTGETDGIWSHYSHLAFKVKIKGKE